MAIGDASDVPADTDPCLRLIASVYGDRRAARSGVRLMQHIHDGLAVLNVICSRDVIVVAARAWCLHPVVQDTASFVDATRPGGILDVDLPAAAVALAMDYRVTANAFLSHDVDTRGRGPADGALPETRLLLIADKVQNHLDFVAHHRASHPRSAALTRYFQRWFEHLGIDDAERERLEQVILSRR